MKKTCLRSSGYFLFYLFLIHGVALIFFSVFRLALFFSADYKFSATVEGDLHLQSLAFLKGVWFDNVIACYILLLPMVLFWIASLCNYVSKRLFQFAAVFFAVFYSSAFIISAANIPYFQYFFKPINSSIFNWVEYGGTTAQMVLGESTYYFPIGLGIISIVLFSWIVFLLSSYFYHRTSNEHCRMNGLKPRLTVFMVGVLCVSLCVFGIRGRMGYNPIKVSQAYYCQDPFLNQLGVNPVFNLLTSTLDSYRKENRSLHLMPDNEALASVKRYLKRDGITDISPIAQNVEKIGHPNRKNVVLIFMESMSAQLMGSYGSTQKLTPYLDSLYLQSLSFKNIYSSGIHTNHGIYSTLYSFPVIMKRNAMKGTVIPVYSGLPTVLKDNGYRNLFFMTHESQYDNMNAFLRTNGFDEIYSQENYPPGKVVNSFGVQDDFMYQYALPILNKKAKAGAPFFTVLLSISNHPPYVIPSYFKPRSEKIEDQIVEYADWSIRKFMDEARKQDWFDNTIFVFLADHGKMVGTPECEMPQSYNHIPLMIYGKNIAHSVYEGFGGQIDVAPTLLELLNVSYIQNNFGVNLLGEKRPYIFFTADNMIGARDASRLFIYSPESGQQFMYAISGDKRIPVSDQSKFEDLKKYCFSMLQSTELLVRKGCTVNKPHKNSF